VVPPHNDIDVFSQDLGFIAILDEDGLEESRLLGFNLVVGGGLGATHGEPQTYPRIGDVIGFLTPDRTLKVAETVVMIQRDFGDRTERKHARLKYTIDDRGIDWFKAELFKRLGFALEPPRAFEFNTQGDRFGWLRGHDGRWHLTLRIESGRVADRPGAMHLTGSQKIAQVTGAISAHPQSEPDHRQCAARRVHESIRLLRITGSRSTCHQPQCGAMRWPRAMPTCSLACRGRRYLPDFTEGRRGSPNRVSEHSADPANYRYPNGCARPYLAEIALIGRAPGRYTLRLGADAVGQRLNVIYRDNIDENAILTVLDELFARYARERQTDERFGDFLWRAQLLTPEKRP
jgi:sulfite reductase (NADPH) hemoprotein beta-component